MPFSMEEKEKEYILNVFNFNDVETMLINNKKIVINDAIQGKIE